MLESFRAFHQTARRKNWKFIGNFGKTCLYLVTFEVGDYSNYIPPESHTVILASPLGLQFV